MSLKICVSYSEEKEKNEVLKALKPLICGRVKIKYKAGEKYNRLYIISDRVAKEEKKSYNSIK